MIPPEVLQLILVSLWSMNDILRGGKGIEIAFPSRDWMMDLLPSGYEEEKPEIDQGLLALFAKAMKSDKMAE